MKREKNPGLVFFWKKIHPDHLIHSRLARMKHKGYRKIPSFKVYTTVSEFTMIFHRIHISTMYVRAMYVVI